MRKTFILSMAIAVLAFAGCKKENNVTTLRATISGFHSAKDAKVYIDEDYYSCWNTTGDQVILNTSTQNVYKDNDNYFHIAVSEADQSAETFYSIYPASAVNGTSVTAQTSVTIPAVQLYQEVEGKQKIDALMAAMGTQRLAFKNLCALLEVNVQDLPTAARLTKIEVTTTTNAPLCGTGTVTFTSSDNITLGTLSGGINGGKTIKLQFDQDNKNNGTYYVVVPPVSNTGFDISVHYRMPNTTEGAIQLFSKRMKQTTTTNTLASSQYGSIVCDMDNSTPKEHLPGAYSVSNTNQVYFSRGNLKFDASSTPKYSFELNQSVYTPTDGTNHSVSETGYLPFFCNDQSTAMNPNNPVLHDNNHKGTPIDYASFAIAPTTTGAWRTLTRDEWNFLVSRHTQGIGSPLGTVSHACYAYVKVNGQFGMMMFPDLFEWPTTVPTSRIPGTLNGASSNWNGIEYTTAEWSQLEEAGCIFLIAAGWTDWTPSQQGDPGFYWSITPVENSTTNKDAYVFYFDQNNGSFSNQGTTYNSPTANQYASYGHGFMVRLVYDPNATPWTQE